MSDVHQKASEIFADALEREPRERAEFVRERCDGDSKLFDEVCSLLQYTGEGQALSDLALGVTPLPQEIGGYSIIERVGEGGMGVVYRARQTVPFERELAIKVVRSGLLSDLLIRRFEIERRALARLNHPNIATIYDAGLTDEGLPYFAMEYVDGKPLVEHCRDAGSTLEERLELLVQVCHGVQHAHQNAIIHRDLKPSNILVTMIDGKPTPKIIDFGIAKSLDDPEEGTLTTGFLGTPWYMSPEQLRGEVVDTRTDTYSLGVIFYELLTDGSPYRDAKAGEPDAETLRRRVIQDNPILPSRQPKRFDLPLKRELDWIVQRALSKERERRYQTPIGFALDLDRFLHHEPLVAGPPSVAYRFKKWFQRYKVPATLGFVLFATLLTTTVIVSVQARRLALAAQAEQQRANETSELLRILTESLAPDNRSPREATPTVRPLEKLADLVLNQEHQSPEVMNDITRRTTQRFIALDRTGEAVELAEGVRDLIHRRYGRSSAEGIEASMNLANALRGRGSTLAADTIYRQVAAQQASLLGADDPARGETLVMLAITNHAIQRFDEASAAVDEAIQLYTGVEMEAERLLAISISASILMDQYRYEETLERLDAIADSIVAVRGDRDMESNVVRYNRAILLAHKGEMNEAIDLLRQAVEGGFTVPSTDPHRVPLDQHPEAQRWIELGQLNNLNRLRQLGRKLENEFYTWPLEQQLTMSMKYVESFERFMPGSIANLDMPYFDAAVRSGNCRYARPMLDLLLRLDPSSATSADHLWFEAQCSLIEGDRENAIAKLKRTKELYWENRRRDSEEVLYVEAQLQALAGNYDEAISLLETVPHMTWASWAAYDRAFVPMRDDPRFRAILSSVEAKNPYSFSSFRE